jgi:hypothetical protein
MHSTSLQRGCKKKNTNLNGQKGIEKMEIEMKRRNSFFELGMVQP